MTAPPVTEVRVTVIVTFYNQRQWVDQALDSVLAQTENDVQLIITDDGSTDGTQVRVQDWRDRHGQVGESLLAQVNGGLPAALNRALPLIRGRFVMILNGDDWLDPLRLEHQADALESAPASVGVVYSDLRVVDVDGSPTGEVFPPSDQGRPEGQLLHRMITAPLFGMPCVMFRAQVLDTIGPWDETLLADDFDFLLRTAAAGFEFLYLPATDTNYRKYGSSLTGGRNGPLAESRIAALLKLRGCDAATDRLIDQRVQNLAIAMHTMGHDGQVTRHRLRQVLRRSPSRRVVRAVVESHLRIPPGRLSPSYWAWRRSDATNEDGRRL